MKKILILLVLFTCACSADAARLSSKSSTAVLMRNANGGEHYEEQSAWNYRGGASHAYSSAPIPGASHATDVLRRELLRAGYRIVDPKRMAAIRREKAARLALENNV